MSKAISSPCVGVCSSGIGDEVCRGCKRFAHEVINWNSYTHYERELIQQRLNSFLIKLIRLKIQSIDIKMLNIFISDENITFDESLDVHLRVYGLIKKYRHKAVSPEAWGVRLRPLYKGLSVAALHELIEREFYDLSQAHYERYIKPGIVNRGDPA